jgi:hypothetical protein
VLQQRPNGLAGPPLVPGAKCQCQLRSILPEMPDVYPQVASVPTMRPWTTCCLRRSSAMLGALVGAALQPCGSSSIPFHARVGTGASKARAETKEVKSEKATRSFMMNKGGQWRLNVARRERRGCAKIRTRLKLYVRKTSAVVLASRPHPAMNTNHRKPSLSSSYNRPPAGTVAVNRHRCSAG